MPKIRNFHEKLEGDFQRLTNEIKEQRERIEIKNLPEKEIIRQSLRIFEEAPAAKETAPVPAESGESVSFLPSYLSGQNVDEKVKLEVERLVGMVFKEGIEKAIRESKKHPPFVADAFHDALVDKLLPELKKRGVI